jgi:hypothetical protein
VEKKRSRAEAMTLTMEIERLISRRSLFFAREGAVQYSAAIGTIQGRVRKRKREERRRPEIGEIKMTNQKTKQFKQFREYSRITKPIIDYGCESE